MKGTEKEGLAPGYLKGLLLFVGGTPSWIFVPPRRCKESWVTPKQPMGPPHGGTNGSAPRQGQRVYLQEGQEV